MSGNFCVFLFLFLFHFLPFQIFRPFSLNIALSPFRSFIPLSPFPISTCLPSRKPFFFICAFQLIYHHASGKILHFYEIIRISCDFMMTHVLFRLFFKLIGDFGWFGKENMWKKLGCENIELGFGFCSWKMRNCVKFDLCIKSA